MLRCCVGIARAACILLWRNSFSALGLDRSNVPDEVSRDRDDGPAPAPRAASTVRVMMAHE